MSKHFKELNGVMVGLERNTYEDIDKNCPPQFVGIAQLYRGAFLAHIITADLMREWMNGSDRQEVLLHLAGLHNTFVFFEDGIDYEEHDLDRDGKEIPIKADTAFEQFLDLNKALGEMDYTKAWLMYLGLRELLGFTQDDISQMWDSPRWKQYGHGVAITPSLEALAQAKRIEELEFQANTAVVRSIITLYDNGLHDSQATNHLLWRHFSKIEPITGSKLYDIHAIFEEWKEDFFKQVNGDKHYIDRIRAAIGMSKPEEEQVNE